MPLFFIDMAGAEQATDAAEFADLDAARNAAITQLGVYLQHHPEFAYARHWRVDVRDSSRRLLLHVIIATVDAPPFINKESFAS